MPSPRRSHIYVSAHTAPNRWLAVNLSVLFPGLGQIYSGAVGKGGLIAIATASLLVYATWSIFGAAGNTLTGFWLLGFSVVIYLISLFDTYHGTTASHPAKISPTKTAKDPWYAVFLSQILPGLGHLYLQRAVIGGLFLISWIAIALLANAHSRLLPLPPIIWAVACRHVYHVSAQRHPSRGQIIGTITLGVLLLRLFLGYIPPGIDHSVQQFIVPSNSMLPTLQPNDRMFVSKAEDYTPQLGDLVVFQAPEAAIDEAAEAAEIAKTVNTADTFFVKRIIAVPGQQVQVARGQVLINQRPLIEPYVQQTANYEWGPEVTPPDAYFVLGDYRNQSSDSHIWGFLPRSDIVGKAYKIYWPPGRVRSLEGALGGGED